MFQYIETVCVIIFSVEIILRCIAAHGNPAFRGSWCEPAYFLGYIFSFQGVFDIISVVPWYVDQFTSADDIKQLVLFRALRLFRLLRIERYLGAVSIFYQVFTSRSISLICAGFLLVVWTLVFATLLHETEKDNMQVQGITKMTMAERFRSVPSALFYTFIHLTGDYPLYKYTYWGRLVNVFMIMLGQILIGLPIGIIIDGFQEAIAEKAQRDAEEEDEEEDKKDEEEDKKKDGEEEASKEPSFQESLFALVEGYGLSGIYFNIIQALVIMLAFGNLLVQSDKAWYGAEMFPDDPQFTVGDFFEIVGYVAATFFVVEYVIRIYCCPVDPKFEGGSKFTAETWKDWNQNDTTRRLCYMTDFMGVIDLIAWVSFFTAQAFDAQSDARVIIGSFQVLMLIKFDRVCPVFTIIDDAIGSKDTRSYLVCTLILALIVWILFASLFFVFEQDEADQHGSFANMPLSLFYTMILMGGEWCRCDLQIPFGEITGVFLAIFGIGIVGIPPSIFADTFSDVNEQATAALKAKQDPDTENCCSETCDDMVCWKRARPGDEGAKSSSGKGSGTGSGRSLRGDVERGNPSANYGTASPNPSSDWVAEGLAYQG
jgi:voltage-gated potassium channel